MTSLTYPPITNAPKVRPIDKARLNDDDDIVLTCCRFVNPLHKNVHKIVCNAIEEILLVSKPQESPSLSYPEPPL